MNSFGSNIAVNVWWNHIANIIPIPDTCGHPDPGLSLADISFDKMNEEREIQAELDFFGDPL